LSSGKPLGEIGSDNPVMLLSAGIADDYYHNMLTASNVIEPPREESRVSYSCAPSHFVGVAQRFYNTVPVGWEQVRVLARDMPLTLVSEFDLSSQIRAI
jgi:hypothetical protein